MPIVVPRWNNAQSNLQMASANHLPNSVYLSGTSVSGWMPTKILPAAAAFPWTRVGFTLITDYLDESRGGEEETIEGFEQPKLALQLLSGGPVGRIYGVIDSSAWVTPEAISPVDLPEPWKVVCVPPPVLKDSGPGLASRKAD